jgi:TonB-dependent starch-binding outer membrane protein SusC
MHYNNYHFLRKIVNILVVLLCLLSPVSLFAQEDGEKITYTGLVRGFDGKPVKGATVTTRDKKFATLTNEEGKFSITVPKVNSRVLVVTSGDDFKPYEIRTGDNAVTDFKVRLQKATTEVVVVGYGSKKKDDVSGAVTVVGSDQITRQPITSIDQGLAGLTPGVTLREGSGAPGSGPEILIRGINGFGNNRPLIVIDDVIFENSGANNTDQNVNPLAYLNPEDVESVVILKDAATKAIYGSRATAGVILVTTKKGKVGKTKIGFTAQVGYSNLMEFENPNVLNAQELAQFRKEKAIDDVRATNPTYADPKIPVPDNVLLASPINFSPNVLNSINAGNYGEGTNWFNEVTRIAVNNNYNLNISGGTQNVKYFISGNYLKQEGVILANDLTRFAFRSNIDVKVTDKIRFGLNLSPSRTDQNRSADDPSGGQFSSGSTITSTYWLDPSAPVRTPTGALTNVARRLGDSLTSNWQTNPVYQVENEQQTKKQIQVLLGSYLEFEPVKNLIFRTQLNYAYNQNRARNFLPRTIIPDNNNTYTPLVHPDSARASLFNSFSNNIISDNTLRYVINKGKHDANIMVGYSAQDRSEETSSLNAIRLLDEAFILPASNNTSQAVVGNFTGNESFVNFRLISFISRVNYTFDNKYLLTASVRRDGSSRFGRTVQYGNFPAASLAWRITEEKFMQKLKNSWLNELRIEGGYGLTGNTAISNYDHLGSVGQTPYAFNGGLALGYSLSELPNPNVTWETSKQTDIGLNATLFKNRVNISFNAFEQITEGLLAGIPYSWITGFGSVTGNQQSRLSNKGFEANVDVRVIRKKDASWTMGINVSKYKNEILDYYLPGGFLSGNAGNGTQIAISQAGQPIGMFRGLQYLGLYTAADIANPNVPKYAGAREGSLKYLDGNNNGILDGNFQQDYVVLANPHPDLMFGMNHQIQFKYFSIRATFAGQFGGAIYDLRREIMWNVDGNFNVDRAMLDRWRPGDDPTKKFFPTTAGGGNLTRLVRFPGSNKIYDGTYIGLKNLYFGYNIGKILNLKRKVVDGGEFFVSMRNVFYVAKYKFGNPEVRRSNDGSALRSVNYGSYPVSRVTTVGINLSF